MPNGANGAIGRLAGVARLTAKVVRWMQRKPSAVKPHMRASKVRGGEKVGEMTVLLVHASAFLQQMIAYPIWPKVKAN